ncbi:hypothetical protein DFH08DRAFT_782626 [Mycena albidolilacea]|uniref:Uncharacterized protein n=1 Tax=Mycena albidolilacea TaxID=1033008 RepID=A0AAD6ZXF0_9AGAR|nr:hypothetical protein DFH08DRAFT_782626 [Mycena albidolilacea]
MSADCTAGNGVLTEKDRDNIRAFKLRMLSKMPRVAFNHMRNTFSHKMDISSEWVILHRIALLTRIEPHWFHCCPNSCIAYTSQYSNLSHCPYPDCREAHYTPAGTPRRLFCYLPLIPRLQGLFSNPKTVEELLYRHRYQSRHNEVSDVFDSIHYQNLRKTKVTVDGRELAHCYFSGK